MLGIKFGIVSVLLVFASQSIIVSNGALPSSDGGYDITIGIRDAADVNVQAYVDNIKTAFGVLSTQMFMATDETFYVKSLKIIVPHTWTWPGAATTLESYQSADIRISATNTFPQVDNPNLCGLPGSHIDLPSTFFKTVNSGKYGPTWKALINLWARYRWGVWEEHGYPGDARFPYFFRGDDGWTVTGCSNAPLVGEFRQLDGTPCNATQETPLNANCRFFPSPTENTATSSLTHFPWIESVTKFCDAEHKRETPNKQNLFCNFKSVTETIKSSLDSKAVTAKRNNVPSMTVEVVEAARDKLLYVLLDEGTIAATETGLAITAATEIGKLFDAALPNGAIVALGTYPTSVTNPNVNEIIPFGTLDGRRDEFIEKIGNFQAIPTANRDFGQAISQAAAAIKSVGLPNGGIILLLKTAGATNSTSFSYEKDVELALLEQNIHLYSIELSGASNERKNLDNLAAATSGKNVAINSLANATPIAKELVDAVSTAYTAAPIALAAPRITYRGEVTPNQAYTIPVLANTEMVTFYLASPDKLPNLSQIRAGIDNQDMMHLATFARGDEYGENENALTRFTYTGPLDVSAFTLRQVTFTFNGTSNAHLIVMAGGANVATELSVRVSTSAVNNLVDLDPSAIVNRNAPFAIFALVQQNGRSIAGAHVEAVLELVGGSESESLTLFDNGDGSEDVAANDGIYSGVIVPPTDGFYTIRVTVSKAASTRMVIYKLPESSFQRLIPVDQQFESSDSIEIPDAIFQTASFDGTVQVQHREDYVTVISSINDFVVTKGTGNALVLTHTAPKLLGMTGSPTVYTYYLSSSRQELLDMDVENPTAEVLVTHTDVGANPGSEITVNQNFNRIGLFYAAVVSSTTNAKSLLSNIQDITMAEEEGSPTTSTATDPTDPEASTESEKSKPWLKKTEGIITIVVIVLVVFAAAGAGYWYQKRRSASKTGTTFATSA